MARLRAWPVHVEISKSLSDAREPSYRAVRYTNDSSSSRRTAPLLVVYTVYTSSPLWCVAAARLRGGHGIEWEIDQHALLLSFDGIELLKYDA